MSSGEGDQPLADGLSIHCPGDDTNDDKKSAQKDLLLHSRTGYLSHVKRHYNRYAAAIEHFDPVDEIREILHDFIAAFGAFSVGHSKYMELLSLLEPDEVDRWEEQYTGIRDLLEESKRQFNDIDRTRSLESYVSPRDSASQTGSRTSSTASARARAAAKKSALSAKMEYLKKQQDMESKLLLQEQTLERQKKEGVMRLEQLKLEADFQAVSAEEKTLAEFSDTGRHRSIPVQDVTSGDLKSDNDQKQDTCDVTRQTSTLGLDIGQNIQDMGNVTKRSTVGLDVNQNIQYMHGVSKHSGAQGPEVRWKVPVHDVMTDSCALQPEDSRHNPQQRFETPQHATPIHVNDNSASLMKLMDAMNLPRTSLAKYDGDPLQYWFFMNAFDSVVGHTTVDDGTKLNRLFEYCTGKAARVIQPCALMRSTEGYNRARELLARRFGNEYQISEAWVKKVAEGPAIKTFSGEALQDLADDVSCCVETLRAMNMIGEIDSRLRMVKIIGRLPTFVQGRWRNVAVDTLEKTGHYPSIVDLVGFLEKVAREANDPVFGYLPDKPKDQKKEKEPSRPHNRYVALSTSAPSKGNTENKGSHVESSKDNHSESKKCYLCTKDHLLSNCGRFLAMNPQEKLDSIKKYKLCFNCMQSRHMSKFCKSPVCECGRRHHKTLHDVLTPSAGREVAKSCASMQSRGEGVVALPIVPVIIMEGHRELMTHALLDPGSTRTFCNRSVVDSLNLSGMSTEVNLETLNDGKDTKALEVSFEVASKRRGKHVKLSKVLALDRFPNLGGCGARPTDIDRWEHLRGLTMPHNIDVQLLIGQDHPQALMPLEVRHGSDREPYAVRTVLGWTINGPMAQDESDLADISTVCAFVQSKQNPDACLESQVEQFWKVDEVPAYGPVMSVTDKKVVQEWDQNAKLVDGHYQLPIPFEQTDDLPDNRFVAERRLRSLGRRLSRDPELHAKYKHGIDDLVAKNYAEPVLHEETTSQVVWYLPHHNVVNVNKPDKVRIVFDCAAECKGVSLNKRVRQGPDLNNKLLGVLVRFRENRVAVMGDIEAMFHQVRVDPCQRDALRFLWWRDGDMRRDIETYRMTCHLFGGVWSPSAATYALQRVVRDNKDDFPPEVLALVTHNFYVDDCLFSVHDEETAVRTVEQLCQLLRRGGFHLTKWLSNSRDVICTIPVEERAKPVKELDLDLGSSLPVERALGVHWDTEKDCFGIQLKYKEPVYTRRGVLSIMSSVYDPMGLVAPCVLLAKLIFQAECRRAQVGWDDPMDPANQTRWTKWLRELPKLRDMHLKRCIVPHDFGSVVQAELHHFSDASQEAYGAVSFLRLVSETGAVHCCFVLGKSKLAPMRQMTIPRLELVAAVVAVKLDATLRKELTIQIDRSVFWCDSMVVIHYIKNTNRRFQTFVANRVAVIQDESQPDQWRHVDSKRNPADDASRGLDADAMVSCSRWLQGPEFLWREEAEWPAMPTCNPDLLADDSELKKEAKTFETVVKSEAPSILDVLKRYSDWFRLRKAVAWLCRFKRYCCKKYLERSTSDELKSLRGPISVGELAAATDDVVRIVQQEAFTRDIIPGEEKMSLKTNSSLVSLNPVVEDGILRVGGRIGRAPVSYELRHPIILPPKHHVTQMIIRYYHAICGHQGPAQVLAAIREQFWIIHGKNACRQAMRNCLHCKRRNALKGRQLMAPLPVERLMPNKPPFTYVGVDYFGPLHVKRARTMVKRYGALFTCMTTRAVHIEIAHSLELDSFLCALQRFIGRRGKPAIMFSDNGTNFRGGERELRECIEAWNEQQLNSAMVQQNIEWRFNPPYASHMGGVWERMIRSTRRIFKALAGEQVLTDEGLHTFMVETEKILNDRPITSISQDATDPEPLSPSKLLLLRDNTSLPLGTFNPSDQYSKRYWRQAQYLANVFWQRWLREYLPCLQERQKWHHLRDNFKEHDLVLVSDENLQRGQWPLGRVVETYPDEFGQVRSAKVRVGGNTKTRPIHKLVFLEGHLSSDETKKDNQHETKKDILAEDRHSMDADDSQIRSAEDTQVVTPDTHLPRRQRRLPRRFDDFALE